MEYGVWSTPHRVRRHMQKLRGNSTEAAESNEERFSTRNLLIFLVSSSSLEFTCLLYCYTTYIAHGTLNIAHYIEVHSH